MNCPPFCLFWTLFGQILGTFPIGPVSIIPWLLNWITRVYFELNNILNWILGKAILNRILNESFFGKIQILNWIRLGIVNHYVTTKIVTEKAKKWPKMARFWPKLCHNSRVMAREVSFYQCLWVTKFCAKFGCSRIPRTTRMHNSLIVLRCMWKEPAPLKIETKAL